jgi:hypothetical protein
MATRGHAVELAADHVGEVGEIHLDRAVGRRVGETIAVESTHEVRVKDLARRILTFSTSSSGELGDRVEEMLRMLKSVFFL